LLNLLSNAIKFTDRGEIVLHASARPVRSAAVELDFSVRDTGIGISPDDQERIFSSFEQVGPSSRGGTGLGLTISRRYVQMMGGELSVESRLGEGAHFRFRIEVPFADGVRRDSGEVRSTPSRHHDQPVSVLIVDHSEEGRLLVRSLLKPLGFTVEEAAGLVQARSVIDDRRIDIVLVGWYLPDGEGIDLIHDYRGRGPALVMLTANAMSESREAALEAGADGFLSKPFLERDLLELIDEILKRKLASGEPKIPPQGNAQTLRELLSALSEGEHEQLVRAAISLNPVEIESAIKAVTGKVPILAEQLLSLARKRHYQELWDALGIEGSEA
jgi:hypothetical protein